MSEAVIEVGKRHIREINEEIQAACAAGKKVIVRNTLSASACRRVPMSLSRAASAITVAASMTVPPSPSNAIAAGRSAKACPMATSPLAAMPACRRGLP